MGNIFGLTWKPKHLKLYNMENLIGKTVNFDMTSVDSNAFNLLAGFKKQAKKENWSSNEIEQVLAEAIAGDYNHLVATLAIHCNGPEEEEI